MKFQVAVLLAFLSVISYSQITPVITFNDIVCVYGANEITFRARSNSNAKIFYRIVSGENVIIRRVYDSNDSIVQIIGAGTARIKASVGETEEYKAAEKVINLSVSKKNLYVIVNDISRTYGESISNYTFNYSGFVNYDNEYSLDELPIANSTATIFSSPGTYEIKVSGGKAKNYFLIGRSGKLTIYKRTLNAYIPYISRTYGDNNSLIDIKYEGFINGENASVLDIKPKWTCIADSTSDVGSYDIVLTGGDDDNYDIIRLSGTLVITKAIIDVTIDDVTRVYGDLNPLLNKPRYTGFKLGHDTTIFESLPGVTTNAEKDSPAATFPIYFTPHPPLLKAGYSINYDVDAKEGLFTILRTPFDIKIHSMNRWVGGDDPDLEFTYDTSQFKLNHNIGDLLPNKSLKANCSVTSLPGKYRIEFQQDDFRNPNYEFRENEAYLRIIDTLFVSKEAVTVQTCKNSSGLLGLNNSKLDNATFTWQISTDSVHFETIPPGGRFFGKTNGFLQIDSVKEGDNHLRFRCIVENAFLTDSTEMSGFHSKRDTSGVFGIAFKIGPPAALIALKGQHTLICTDDSVKSYQWGMGSETLPNGTSQFYYDSDLQISNLLNYWVVTTYDNGCATKSYYNGQSIPNTSDATQDISITITPNPNSGHCQIDVSNLIPHYETIISIHKYSGEVERVIPINDNMYGFIRHYEYNLEKGLYIIHVSQINRRSIAKMIVEN